MNGHILAKAWIALRYLSTPLWLTHTWQFQHKHQIWVETTTPEIPLSYKNDSLIMDTIHQVGIISKELVTISWCWIYLQVAIADIAGTDHNIADSMLSGQPYTTFSSR